MRQIAPSTISVEAWVQGSYINGLFYPSFKPLYSVVKIAVFFKSTECSGCFTCTCFATSEAVELGLQCSLNLDFRDLSISPTYVASHLILYWSHHVLFTHRVLEFHQQLSLTLNWNISFVVCPSGVNFGTV